MIDIGDTWACASGSSNGVPQLLRCRTNLADVVGSRLHSRLLRIIWRYQATDASGLPSDELADWMATFENVAVGELERDFVAIFVSVRVGDCIKEWNAYIGDVQRTCDRLNLALESYDPFPIEITVEDDPSWATYTGLLEVIGANKLDGSKFGHAQGE